MKKIITAIALTTASFTAQADVVGMFCAEVSESSRLAVEAERAGVPKSVLHDRVDSQVEDDLKEMFHNVVDYSYSMSPNHRASEITEKVYTLCVQHIKGAM